MFRDVPRGETHCGYIVPLDDMQVFADAIVALDGNPDTRSLVERGHAAIRRALGKDVGLLYAEDDPCDA